MLPRKRFKMKYGHVEFMAKATVKHDLARKNGKSLRQAAQDIKASVSNGTSEFMHLIPSKGYHSFLEWLTVSHIEGWRKQALNSWIPKVKYVSKNAMIERMTKAYEETADVSTKASLDNLVSETPDSNLNEPFVKVTGKKAIDFRPKVSDSEKSMLEALADYVAHYLSSTSGSS